MPFQVPLLRSLKARILVLMLAMFVVSIASLTLGARWLLRSDIEKLLGDQQRATVDLVARQIVASFNVRNEALKQIASEIAPTLMDHPQALQALLDKHPVMQLMFNFGVFVTGPDGTAMAEAPRMGREGLNYMDRDHVEVALHEGKAIVGKPVIGKTVKAPSFGMAVPVRDGKGKVIGALVGAIDLSKPNFLDSVIDSRYGQSGGYLIVDPRHRLFVTATANNRNLIMQPLPQPGVNPVLDRRLLGFDGTAVNVNSLGFEVMTSSARIPAADWFIIATLPTQEAFAPLQSLERRLVGAAAVLTLLALLVTGWMLRRLLLPMEAAAQAIRSIPETGQADIALPIAVDDEVGQLIGGFNRAMAVAAARERALRDSEERYARIVDGTNEGFWEWNLITDCIVVSARFEAMLGYAQGEWICTHQNWLAHMHPQDVGPSAERFEDHVRGVTPRYVSEFRMKTKSGEWLWIQSKGKVASRDGHGTAVLVSGTLTDITARKNAQLALEAMNKDFVTLLESSFDFLYFKDRDGRFRYCSQSLATLTGHKGWRDMVGKHDLDVFPVETARVYIEEEMPIFAKGIPMLNKVDPYIKTDGSPGWVSTNKWPIFDEDGTTVVGIFGISRDVTDTKQREDELRVLATTDFLTGVESRRSFIGEVEHEIARMQRDPASPCAVLMFDLDHFKRVNDTWGHAVGDEVLKHVARLAAREIRKVDHVGRLGGEEFAVLMPGAGLAAANVFAHRLLRLIEGTPVEVAGQSISVTVSIGLSELWASDPAADAALERVDEALYRAKHNGRNRVETAS